MATRVQFRRGTTAQTAAFTGASGEMTVDTTKNTLVVHDGTTMGGFPLAKETDLASIITDLVSDTTPQLGGNLDPNGNEISGDLIPDTDDTHSLGSATKRWKDVFIGPGSLYVGDQKVIEDNSGTIVVSADSDQNIQVRSQGSGDIEFLPNGSGIIQMKGTLSLQAGNNLTSSDANPIQVQVGLNMNGEVITGLPNPSSSSDAATMNYVQTYAGGLTGNSANWDVAYSWGDHGSAGYVGTADANTFTNNNIIDTSSSDPALRITQRGAGHALLVEDSANPDASPFYIDADGNCVIAGNLTVNGTQTIVNSNEVNINDSIIVLNADETGTPSSNSGIEVERGTSSNVSFLWDEANDHWSTGTAYLSAGRVEARNDGLDKILFRGISNLGTSGDRAITIESPSSDSIDAPFSFVTSNSFAWKIDGSEKMQLGPDGELLIGTSTDNGHHKLQIEADSSTTYTEGAYVFLRDTNASGTLNEHSSGIHLKADGFSPSNHDWDRLYMRWSAQGRYQIGLRDVVNDANTQILNVKVGDDTHGSATCSLNLPRVYRTGMENPTNAWITLAQDAEGATGSHIKFGTTPDSASASATEHMRLNKDGNLLINTDIDSGNGSKLQVNGNLSVANGNVLIGGSGTIAGSTWANGAFHLGDATLGWAMDTNEFYNSGAGIIGCLDGSLTLNAHNGNIDLNPTNGTARVGGHEILTTNSTIDADTVDGIDGSALTQLGALQTNTGIKYFKSTGRPIDATASASLQAFSDSASDGAMMAFHRSSTYAVYMGLDTDNTFKIGGWSHGDQKFGLKYEPTTQNFAIGGQMYVGWKDGTERTASYLWMADSDHGERAMHCNSNNIGFLKQDNNWGAYCDDSGNWTAVGNVTAYSDIKLKENIETIDNAVTKVKQIRGVTFDRIDAPEMGRQAGVIAQEVERVLPEVVTMEADDTKGVAYGNMVGLLIEAIKEQQDRIETLEATIAAMAEK